MLVRLGRAVYWVAATVACLLVTGIAYTFSTGQAQAPQILVLCGIPAVIIFLAGRLVRYVLAGE
jgi:hypothetical protein